MVQNAQKRRLLQRNKKKEETKTKKDADSSNCVWLLGRVNIKKRRTIKRRAAASVKATKKTKRKRNKKNKCNTRERQRGIRPEDTSSSHMWLVNYGERTSTNLLALGYPFLGPSRHVRAFCCMPWSSPDFLCSDPFRHETFRPLFRHPAPFLLVLQGLQSSTGRRSYRRL